MRNRIFLSPPNLRGNEREYVADVFASNYIAPAGPMIGRFEAAVAASLDTGFSACALSSATAGLDLLFDHLGVGPGDVVVCSDLTFVASIAPAVHRGAEPFFVDCEPDSWSMSPAALDAALAGLRTEGRRVKAVVAVDLYGQCCDYARLAPVCHRHGVALVEDAAEALGASWRDAEGAWRKAGEAGVAAVFSFNGNKIITSSGGGMLVSRDAALVEKARFLSQQAKEPRPWYEHERLGYNYRMSNVSAAIGLGQFEQLGRKVARRREIFALYAQLLPELEFMSEPASSQGSRWLTAALLPRGAAAGPAEVIAALEAENIEARRIWKPMHLQPVFKAARVTDGGKVAEDIFERGVCLPSGDGMEDDEVEAVAEIVRRAFGGF